MSTLGPLTGTFYSTIPSIANTRPATGPVPPIGFGDTLAGAAPGSLDGESLPGSLPRGGDTLSQSVASTIAQSDANAGTLDATSQQAAAADAEISMPAAPLAHILLQFRAVGRAQRVAGQALQGLRTTRQATPARGTGAPVSKEAIKGAARAYVKVERLTKGGSAATAVDVSDANI